MPYRTFALTGMLLMVAAACGAGESRPLPWSAGTGLAARFSANASGKTAIADDPAEKAVRFDIAFPPGVDQWAYPVLKLRPDESLADVDEIRFAFKASQGDPAAGYRFANVMFGAETPFYRLPLPSGEWQTVRIRVADAVKDPAAARDIRIGMNPKDTRLTFWIRDLAFLAEREIAPRPRPSDASEAIAPDAPGAVFLNGEALRFTLRPFVQGGAQGKRWTLRDWRGQVLQEGPWPTGGDGALTLDTLANGYYNLALAASAPEAPEAPDAPGIEFPGARSFAVVSDPSKRPPNPDLFFAMDSAQSWLARPDGGNPRQPPNPYEVVSEVARRSGLRMVRERMNWAEVEPEPGRVDWLQYGQNADLLAKRGIGVLGLYHHAPDWVKKDTTSLPSDLRAAYDFGKRAAAHFKGKMTAWEFWNEPDIGFSHDTAWDYAAALKASSLGYKAADPALPVAIAGLAITPLLPFVDVVLESGAAEYFDIFNVHTYHTLPAFPAMLAGIRETMTRHGLENHPIWFTESGPNIEGGGRAESFIPGLKAHDATQEMLVAEYLPKMMVTLQSLGVARDFYFVLPPFSEHGGNKDWGLMRRDFTVKPAYAAFATLVDQLGAARMLGEVDLGPELKGFLYRQGDGKNTLVYWSRSELDREARPAPGLTNAKSFARAFPLPAGGTTRRELYGIDPFGAPFAAKADAIAADRHPRLLLDVGALPVAAPAVSPGRLDPTRQSRFEKAIVFRAALSPDFTVFPSKDGADVAADAPARLRLEVWNLSDASKSGTVSVSGGACAGLPEGGGVTVEAFGKVEFELAFTPELNDEFKGALRVEGVFGGRPATPQVIALRSLDAIKESGRPQEIAAMQDPAHWRKNSTGDTTITYDPAEGAVRFDTRFPPGVDRWTYPVYTLQLPQESLRGAIGIGFETKVSKPGAVVQMLLMAVTRQPYENRDAAYLKVEPPGADWTQRYIPLPSGLDPDAIHQLRFGLNARENDISHWIRDVRVYYAR